MYCVQIEVFEVEGVLHGTQLSNVKTPDSRKHLL